MNGWLNQLIAWVRSDCPYCGGPSKCGACWMAHHPGESYPPMPRAIPPPPHTPPLMPHDARKFLGYSRLLEICDEFGITETDTLKHRLEDWERWQRDLCERGELSA